MQTLIRDICVDADGKGFSMAVGDQCVLIAREGVNKGQENIPFEYKILNYDEIHSSVYSGSMISLVRTGHAFMGYIPTPNCDKPCTGD